MAGCLTSPVDLEVLQCVSNGCYQLKLLVLLAGRQSQQVCLNTMVLKVLQVHWQHAHSVIYMQHRVAACLHVATWPP